MIALLSREVDQRPLRRGKLYPRARQGAADSIAARPLPQLFNKVSANMLTIPGSGVTWLRGYVQGRPIDRCNA
jgi:hypothetical protein